MAAKTGKSADGHMMHYLIGAIIERDGKYVMLDRAVFPMGFVGVIGHIEDKESPEQALQREIKEESDLDLKRFELVIEEEKQVLCSRGIRVHYCYVYKCKADGELRLFPEEEKSIGWYAPEQIKTLALEPNWREWLERTKII